MYVHVNKYRCLTVIDALASTSHVQDVGGVGLMRSWNAMQINLEESFVIVLSSGKMRKENSLFSLFLVWIPIRVSIYATCGV
jgi:hypothetical protein